MSDEDYALREGDEEGAARGAKGQLFFNDEFIDDELPTGGPAPIVQNAIAAATGLDSDMDGSDILSGDDLDSDEEMPQDDDITAALSAAAAHKAASTTAPYPEPRYWGMYPRHRPRAKPIKKKRAKAPVSKAVKRPVPIKAPTIGEIMAMKVPIAPKFGQPSFKKARTVKLKPTHGSFSKFKKKPRASMNKPPGANAQKRWLAEEKASQNRKRRRANKSALHDREDRVFTHGAPGQFDEWKRRYERQYLDAFDFLNKL